MPTKYYLILSKTIGVQWLTNWIQWHDFNYHSKVYFSLFELESLLLNCPLWNCGGWSQAEVQAWCCHQPAQLDWCQLAIISPADPINSLLKLSFHSPVHAYTLENSRWPQPRPEALVSEAGNIKAGWRTTDGEEAVRAPADPPTISSDHTNLSKPPLSWSERCWFLNSPSLIITLKFLPFYEIIKFCTTAAGKKFVKITPLSGIVWNCMIHFVFSIYSQEIIA